MSRKKENGAEMGTHIGTTLVIILNRFLGRMITTKIAHMTQLPH